MGLQIAKRPSDSLILIVDDDNDNLAIVGASLRHSGYSVDQASSGEEALTKLKTITPDLILLDINMTGISGLETLKIVRMRENYINVILLSARNDTDDVVLGLDCGADDYICKPFEPMELLARVRAQLRIKDLTDRLAAANRRLETLVDIDDLTGLYNMRSIYQKLESEIGRSKRFNRAVAVVMMDMDDFKDVNDSNDHLFGSFVLSEVGKLVQATIRGVDFAARYGGDEFLIVLSETTVEGVALFGERLRKAIAGHTFTKDGSSLKRTASIGVAVAEPSVKMIDAKTLVRCADHAMYEAKRSGKNCVSAFDMSAIPAATAAKKIS